MTGRPLLHCVIAGTGDTAVRAQGLRRELTGSRLDRTG
jgi:hypothetical protein